MARQGEVLGNPVTGERIEFRRTAADTGGEALAFDYYLAPGGFALGKVDHVHPRQEERFEVEAGQLGVRIDGDEWTATPGTRFAVPRETPHTVWNAGDDEVHALVEMRPALATETLFETAFGLARDGRTNGMGIPGPLQSAVLARAFSAEIRAGAVPNWAQSAIAAALAPAGRLAGYRSRYRKYSGRRPEGTRPDA